MVTNVKIELDDKTREALCLLLTGKKGLATRKQIDDYVLRLVRKSFLPDPPGGPTVRKTLACPKCNKPINGQRPGSGWARRDASDSGPGRRRPGPAHRPRPHRRRRGVPEPSPRGLRVPRGPRPPS